MTKRKLGGQHRRINWRFLVLIVCFAASGLCCGGAQEPNAYNCDSALSGIMGTHLGEYCDALMAEQLEMKVGEFRRNCPVQAEQEKARINQGLKKLGMCTEKQRALDALNQRCQKQMEEADTGMDCMGEDCVPYMDYITGILEVCNDPALKGVYQAKADVLYARVKVRIEEADSFAPLMSMYYSCNLNLEKIKAGNASAMFNKTIKSIQKNGRLDEPPEQGSEMEVVRAMAFKSCERVLLSSVEFLTQDYAEKLSDEKLIMNQKKWKKLYKKLEKLHDNLTNINAEAFFPAVLEVVGLTVDQFNSDMDITPEE